VTKQPKPTNAHYDEAGHLIHDTCYICNKNGAPFGVGVFLRKGTLGLWYCRECKPK